MKTTRLVIFDLGNVLIHVDPLQIASGLARSSELAGLQFHAQLLSSVQQWNIGLIEEYEEGKLSSEGFYERMQDRYRLRTTYDEFKAIWNAGFRENLPVTAMVLQLCKTTCVYGLSNTNPLHFEHLSTQYPVIAALHGCVLSYEIGHRKPKPKIYQAALERAGVRPEQALYVDDDQKFVEAAELLGMRAVRYRSPPELAAMLGL